jgi:hypothetical protein
MDTSDLTPAVLRELRAPRPYPALSLTARTYRREPDNAGDALRLRNLVSEAHKRLHADPEVSHEARKRVGEQLDRAVAEVDLAHAGDGLVLLASADEHQVWRIPRSVQDRVVLSETYLSRNLVAAAAQERPYWVVAGDADEARLWSGAREALRPRDAAGFPVRPEEIPNDSQRMQRKGQARNLYSNEDVRAYLRDVDAALARLLAEAPRPLFLAGLPQTLGVLEEVGDTSDQWSGRLAKGAKTSYADLTGPELAAEIAVPRAEYAERQTAEALDRLGEAQGAKRLAAGVDEVYRAVLEGRLDELVVEEHYEVLVRLKRGSGSTPGSAGEVLEVLQADEVTADQVHEDPELHDDFVDEIIEAALDTDARVSFVPDDRIADYGRIAARLRY